MKMFLILSAMTLAAGCATTGAPSASNPAVDAIQASCDDENQQQTLINGHAYFCEDFDKFNADMKVISARLHARGI
jgi:hypothetical protein